MMKNLIKKIIKEELDDFDWIHGDSIDGEELRDLILSTKATTIPFKWVNGHLNLYGTPIKDLGDLQSVGGNLNLYKTPIKDLGNLQSVGGNLFLRGTPIKDLGNLQSVGGYLYLEGTPIKDLGDLQSVNGSLNLRRTTISEKYSEDQIRQMVNVGGDIYL